MQRSVETGTQEMMQTQEHKKYQDAPDGLYQQYQNSRTQDISVDPSGVHHLVSPPLATGVVHRPKHMTLASYAFLMVMGPAPVKPTRTVFVPSGV